MDNIKTWLDQEENDDEGDLRDLNEGDSNNEGFSVDVDSGEQNLIQVELGEGEAFHVEEVLFDHRRVGPPKKKLTKYRLVNSFDTSLNEENFEGLVYVNRDENFETFLGYMGPENHPKIEKVHWVSNPPNDAGG